jgi:hypothetical protein
MFRTIFLSLVVAMSVTTGAINAQANDIIDIIEKIVDASDSRSTRHDRYRGDYRRGAGRLSCNYSDKGWEEHFSGHSSCGDCLADHGECVERCYEEYYTCTARGTDYYGRVEVVRGMSDREWQAEDEALNECSYRRLSNCRIQNCDRDNELVSSRNCNGRRR